DEIHPGGNTNYAQPLRRKPANGVFSFPQATDDMIPNAHARVLCHRTGRKRRTDDRSTANRQQCLAGNTGCIIGQLDPILSLPLLATAPIKTSLEQILITLPAARSVAGNAIVYQRSLLILNRTF
uniref:Uncharacterized protein n=1 Tax=Anopheles quadriannulatus TaxID=34691 RepID=A0A182X176_ANOQN